MTAESSHESDTQSHLSLIDELTRDYARYLEVDASKQRQSFYDSCEEMLTKLDEFGGLVDMIRSDTSLCVDKTVPQIQEKCENMKQIFERIDKLEMFVNIVKQNVNTMEECVNKAENDMGAFSGFRKMFSSFVSQKKPQDTKLTYDPPEIFVTEEYLVSNSKAQTEAVTQREAVTQKEAVTEAAVKQTPENLEENKESSET